MRTHYMATFPAASPGAEVTWPNTVKVYPDADTQVPLGGAYLDESRAVSVYSDAVSVALTVGTETLTVTTGSPSATGAAPASPGGSTHVGVGDSFYLHYAEDRASTASNLVFDGQTPTIVGSTFSIDANNPGGVVVATGGVIAVTFMSTVQGATPGNEGAYVEAQVALYNGNGLVTQKQKPLASTETTIMTCVLVALVDDAESVLFTHYHEDTVDATLGVNVSVYIQKIA